MHSLERKEFGNGNCTERGDIFEQHEQYGHTAASEDTPHDPNSCGTEEALPPEGEEKAECSSPTAGDTA